MRRGLLLLALAAAPLAACGDDDNSVASSQRGRPVVVTALRPLAEAAEEVGGDAIVVVDLTPVGRSPHALVLTERQRREVLDADLAIVLGKGFQPDLEAAARERDGAVLDVLDALALPDRPGTGGSGLEPHVWLDPTIMGSIVTAIAEAVAEVVPEDAGAVASRAAVLVEQHVELDAQLRQGLAACEHSVIASQHEAFGWFAARYGFTNAGFDAPVPDDDPAPDAARVAAIESMIDDGTVRTLFVESLTPSGSLEVIADEHGLETAVLNPYEGLTPAEHADGATYRSVLLYDLNVLQDQLDCER